LNTTPRKERQERIEYSVKGKMERKKQEGYEEIHE
jgi:hypothetical protein